MSDFITYDETIKLLGEFPFARSYLYVDELTWTKSSALRMAVNIEEEGEMIVWCKENCIGRVHVSSFDAIFFESPKDALLFKLRFV